MKNWFFKLIFHALDEWKISFLVRRARDASGGMIYNDWTPLKLMAQMGQGGLAQLPRGDKPRPHAVC